MSDPAERPTNVRYTVLALTVAMSVIFYLDRFAFSAATKEIRTALEITPSQFGWISSAFFYAYALCQVPAVLYAHRVGYRGVLTICAAGWSLTMWGMAAAPGPIEGAMLPLGFVTLLVFRGLMGVSQAVAYPAAAAYLKDWGPVESRGLFNGMVTMGGRAGNVLAKLCTPALIVLFAAAFVLPQLQSWRIVFFAYGAIGLVWCAFFWYGFRDSPDEHPDCNDAERELLQEGKPRKTNEPPPAPPWGVLLTSGTLWLICGINFFQNVSWILLAEFIQLFLQDLNRSGEGAVAEASGMAFTWFTAWSSSAAGLAAATIALGGAFGNVVGGVANDAAVARLGLPLGRRINGMVLPLIAAGLYLACIGIVNTFVLLGIFVLISFILDSELSSRWAICQDVGGRHTGTIVAFANMCGNLGAGFCATAIGYLANDSHWPAVFVISAASLVATALCWYLVDPTKPIVPEE